MLWNLHHQRFSGFKNQTNFLFPTKNPHNASERSLPTNISVNLPITLYQQDPFKIHWVVGKKGMKYKTLTQLRGIINANQCESTVSL